MFEPWMVFVLLAVAVIAIAIGYAVGRSQSDAEEKQKQAEEELSAYKEQVAQHFGKTAELFDKLTHDYREVYEHLAQSSENLCGDQVPRISADVPEGKLLSEDSDGAVTSVKAQPEVTSESESTADVKVVAEADESNAPAADSSDVNAAESKADDNNTDEARPAAESADQPGSNAEDDVAGKTQPDSPVSPPRAAEAVDADSMSEDDDAGKGRKKNRR